MSDRTTAHPWEPAAAAPQTGPDLAALVAALPGPTALFAADAPRFTMVTANEAFVAAVGRSRDAFLGRPLADAFPDADRAASGAGTGEDRSPPGRPAGDRRFGASGLASLRESLEAAIRTGAPQRMTRQRYDLRRPDGGWEPRYWDVLAAPVRGPDGAVHYVLHQADDVTPQVLAEQAVARAELRATRSLERMADAHVALDREFRFTYVNAAAERALGTTRDAMLGRTHWELFPASVDTDAGRAYRRVVADGVEQHVTQHYVGEGYDRHLEIDAYPTDEGGVAVFWRDVTARVQADAALREGEARYRALFGSIDEGFCVVEILVDDRGTAVDYRFLETNPAFVRQTGLVDAVGRTARELVPGLEAHWFEIYGRVVATGEATRFQQGSDAMGRWFDVYAFRVGAPEERRVAILFTDVTVEKMAARERERLVVAVEVERARLAAVFAQTPSMLAIVRGPDYVLEMANAAYLALYAHRDILGKPLLDVVPELRAQGFDALLDRVVATGEPYVGREVPIRLSTTPGAAPAEHFFDFVYLPLVEPDATGTPVCVGVIAHGSDITEQVYARREAERARERANRLQALTAAALAAPLSRAAAARALLREAVAAAGAAGGGVLELTPDGREFVLLDVIGYNEDAVRRTYGRFAADLPTPARDAVREARPVFLRRDEDWAARGYLPPRPAPTRVEGAAWAALPLVIEGRAFGVLTLTFSEPRAFDAEEQAFVLAFARQCAQAIHRAALYEAERGARAEAEAAQERAEGARREAAEANQAKSAFLATMSHELRTPINAIIGYAELLEIGIAGPLTEQQRVYLERLTGSSAHLLGLVNDVLDLAKIEAGETRVAQRDASTGPAVLAALDLVRPQASGKGVRLVDGRPADAGAAYVGDEDRVRQIALNLLSNAVKFTMPGGTVTVTCDTVGETPREAAHLQGAGPWAYVRVADTGIGIAPEEQARIFDPFHQVDTGHTRTKGGTGLGLAISRRLARLMGGDLTVQSAPGAGATFTLWLPAARRTGDAQVETAADRTARAQRDAALLEALGLGRVGAILRQAAPDVLAAYAERLRTDPATPAAHGMRHPQLEDHQASLLADLAQSLVIVDDAGAAAAALLKDGSAIQRTIADQHGARRFAQGWREAALRRDYQILREEIERAVRDRLREGGEAERAADVDVAVRVLLGLVDRAEAVSVQTWRRVADEAGHPAAPGVPDGPPSRAADAGSAAALPARDDG